jgi:biopolymer transport protein ExbD
MALKRRKRKPIKALPELNLTPLIDTAFTLLVIFMVTSPMMHQGIKVKLPQGQSQEANSKKQDLIVSIDKEGALFFNGTPLSLEQLLEQLKKSSAQSTESVVMVKADQGVQYGTVISVVDNIKVVGGIKYVALATQKRA